MATEVIMPKLGQTMEEGVVERWVKKEGDRIEKGDVLLEITTDKATLEVESYGSGILRRILAQEGETVPVTQVIALIAEEGEKLPEIRGKAKEANKLKAKEGKIVPLSPMRKAIAELMVESKRTIPHYYLTVEVDMTESVNRRRELLPEIEKKTGVRLSFNHILIQAVAQALKGSLGLTSRWEGRGIISEERINVGIAVNLDEGLIVPVLKEADKKGLEEIVLETESLVSRAREGKLKVEERSGATFTISNLGVFGIENFLPIINQPQSAILGVGAILKKPAVVEDKLEVKHLMKLTLSVDHRVVDGARAAQFLQKLKEILEKGETVL